MKRRRLKAKKTKQSRPQVRHIKVETGGKYTPGLPFQGELMRCVFCGREEQSDPAVQSGWRAAQWEKTIYYSCPNCFPKDTDSPEAFAAAYVQMISRAIGADAL